MSIAALEEVLWSSEAEDSAEQPPAVVVAQSESEAELMAMLLRAAKSIGLEVNSSPEEFCSQKLVSTSGPYASRVEPPFFPQLPHYGYHQ